MEKVMKTDHVSVESAVTLIGDVLFRCVVDLYEREEARAALDRLEEEADRLAVLRAAWLEKERLKSAVIAWLRAEAELLRLRCNGDAPEWAGYEEAERAWTAACQDTFRRGRRR